MKADATSIRAFLADPAVWFLQFECGIRQKAKDPRWIFGHLRGHVEVAYRTLRMRGVPHEEAVHEVVRLLLASPDFEELTDLAPLHRWVMWPDQLVCAFVAWADARKDVPVDVYLEVEKRWEIPLGPHRLQGSFDLINPVPEGTGLEVTEFKATSNGCDQHKIAQYAFSVQGLTYGLAAQYFELRQLRFEVWEVTRDPLAYRFHPYPFDFHGKHLHEWHDKAWETLDAMQAYRADAIRGWGGFFHSRPDAALCAGELPVPWNPAAPFRRLNPFYTWLQAEPEERPAVATKLLEVGEPWDPMKPRLTDKGLL